MGIAYVSAILGIQLNIKYMSVK